MKMKIRFFISIILLLTINSVNAQSSKTWNSAKANAWYAQHKWINGADFIPATAINQLEMWQKDTFDPKTIDQELGWAEGIGFNTMRVFLHSVAWKEDPSGFKNRVNQYLTIAAKHRIQTIFVFFDDCWNANPKAGKQPDPKPGIHNSGWMQDPGREIKTAADYQELHAYVSDVLISFRHDKRILLWDLYNEPGNSNKKNASLTLLSKIFAWAQEVRPDQPLSAGGSPSHR